MIEVGNMTNDLWMLAGLGPVLCLAMLAGFASCRRRAWREAAEAAFIPPDGGGRAAEYLPQDVEAAERQLGMLLRRMRAYWRAPYDFANSRIADDTEFERCLDLATALGIRIEELSGGLLAASAERERIRHQILLSVTPKPAWLAETGPLGLGASFVPGKAGAQGSRQAGLKTAPA